MTTAILSDFVEVSAGSATIAAMVATIASTGGATGTAVQIFPIVFGSQIRFVKFIN